MAYATLISLSQTLEHILERDQSRLLVAQKRIIGSLNEKVIFLLSILEDSSPSNGEPIRCLEGRIRDAAYEAENIIESHTSPHNFSDSRLRGVISCFWKLIAGLRKVMPVFNHHCEKCTKFYDHNTEQKFGDLQKVIVEFDSILEEVVNIDRNSIENFQPKNPLPTATGSSKSGVGNKSTIEGFDDYLLEIKDRLTGTPSKLQVISIVGMGGIGKTTLARNICVDPLIEYHFDTRAWATVTQKYSVQQMLKGLLGPTVSEGSNEESTENMDEHLYKSLKGMRYLIVLDDLWDINAWEEVKRLFPDDNTGSRIILTTRLLDVAVYAKSSSPICLSLLSLGQSWNLLSHKIFQEEYCPPEFEVIGRKIAENCKGLPLALVVIGGLLFKAKRTLDYWKYIAENVSSAITGNDEQFMGILSLSYYQLPHHQRACFLYMGVFPEDYEVRISRLLMLWIAAGFIKPARLKSLEEVAEEYLKGLIDRNLVLVRKRSYSGQIATCSIHDLMRDLCVMKAQEEKFLQVLSRSVSISPEPTYPQRHLSIHSCTLDHLLDKYDSPIHSLVYFCVKYENYLVRSFTTNFQLLRVLDALTIMFNEFPAEIVELFNLRYIALSHRRNCKLPSSILKLSNLQTLIVYQGKFNLNISTLYLPLEIWNMPLLRNLVFSRSFLPCPSDVQIETKFGVLESLQSLDEVTNFRCTRKALRMMPSLKKLRISYRHDSRTKWSFYCLENLIYLHQVEHLKCHFVSKSYMRYLDPVTVNLAFPPNLKSLTLSGCKISWKNMMTLGLLPNLEVLKLKCHAFEGPVWEANDREFRRLKFLLLECSHLKFWKADETHFPSLQHLTLGKCDELAEIPSGIGDIPTLEVIELYECCPSAVNSAELIQEEQQDSGNDCLQVHVYFSKEEMLRKKKGTYLHKGPWRYDNMQRTSRYHDLQDIIRQNYQV